MKGLDDFDGAMEPYSDDIAASRGAATGDTDQQPLPRAMMTTVISPRGPSAMHTIKPGGSPDSGGNGLATARW